nr:unnamed protein product [Digitaria exilis]
MRRCAATSRSRSRGARTHTRRWHAGTPGRAPADEICCGHRSTRRAASPGGCRGTDPGLPPGARQPPLRIGLRRVVVEHQPGLLEEVPLQELRDGARDRRMAAEAQGTGEGLIYIWGRGSKATLDGEAEQTERRCGRG